MLNVSQVKVRKQLKLWKRTNPVDAVLGAETSTDRFLWGFFKKKKKSFLFCRCHPKCWANINEFKAPYVAVLFLLEAITCIVHRWVSYCTSHHLFLLRKPFSSSTRRSSPPNLPHQFWLFITRGLKLCFHSKGLLEELWKWAIWRISGMHHPRPSHAWIFCNQTESQQTPRKRSARIVSGRASRRKPAVWFPFCTASLSLLT